MVSQSELSESKPTDEQWDDLAVNMLNMSGLNAEGIASVHVQCWKTYVPEFQAALVRTGRVSIDQVPVEE